LARNFEQHEVSLGNDCLKYGIILHEIGHTLGFYHEQSRYDRDDHVEIIESNIESDRLINFRKYSYSFLDNKNVPYDYSSAMHYGSLFYSANNLNTIKTINGQYQRTIGQVNDISFSDIKTANNAYCKKSCSNLLPCQRGGYPNPKNCNKCLCPDGFSGLFCDQIATSIGNLKEFNIFLLIFFYFNLIQKGKCGGLLRSMNETRFIQTPNYPNAYTSKIECNWLIKAPHGYRVKLTFERPFYINCDTSKVEYGPCDNDWLELKTDMNVIYMGGPRYCCNIGPPNPVISKDNEILVLFRSTIDNNNSSVGFKANFDFIDMNGNPMNGLSNPDNKCDFVNCLNDGVCSKETGKCVCTAGFMGSE
jgi:hypothetical protein